MRRGPGKERPVDHAEVLAERHQSIVVSIKVLGPFRVGVVVVVVIG